MKQGDRVKIKIVHFVPIDSKKTACGAVIGKRTGISTMRCLLTCTECKIVIGEPVDFNANIVSKGLM